MNQLASQARREIRSTIELLEKCHVFDNLKEFEIDMIKFQLNLIAKQAINDYRNAASALEHELTEELKSDKV